MEVVPIHSEALDHALENDLFTALDGVLVAQALAVGVPKGKINAIQYVRENNIPFFGICYGMQMAVVEYARNVKGLTAANSTEIDEGNFAPGH